MLKQAATILAALLIATVLAVGIVSYLHPMTATIADISLSRILDGEALAAEEPINWTLGGVLEPGVTHYFENLTVHNIGNVPCNVTLTHDAPDGWVITWAANKTILPVDASVYAPISLYVSPDATPGATYSWNCWVTATEPVV